MSLAVLELDKGADMEELVWGEGQDILLIGLEVSKVEVLEPFFVDVDIGASRLAQGIELLMERLPSMPPEPAK